MPAALSGRGFCDLRPRPERLDWSRKLPPAENVGGESSPQLYVVVVTLYKVCAAHVLSAENSFRGELRTSQIFPGQVKVILVSA